MPTTSEGNRDACFLDTNVLVYLLEGEAKAARSRELLAARAIVSVQVLNELVHVCMRKKKLPIATVREFLEAVKPLVEVVPISLLLHQEALDLAECLGYSFYDCLILAAALATGCTTLYSEDFQDGQRVGGLTIVNPFR